jgi:hypothetical protein
VALYCGGEIRAAISITSEGVSDGRIGIIWIPAIPGTNASREARHSASLVGVWAATEAALLRDVSEQPPAVTARMAAMAAEAAKCAARS